MTTATDKPKLLGHADEPQQSGAVVAVHWGDYRRQEIWVRSGANIGNWYPLGGEFGRPKVWVDQRTTLEKIAHQMGRQPDPGPGPNEAPLHPHWEDVLARGPVVLLTPAADGPYRAGWKAGRRAMWEDLENAVDDEPEDGAR